MTYHHLAGAAVAALLTTTALSAQTAPEFVQFDANQLVGALHHPAGAEASNVAFLVAHRTSNFMNHISATELSARGYTVLGLNPQSINNEAAVDWDTIALDVREGVRYLRGLDGIDTVVLIAHSGGGPTMSYYQAVAEKGVGYCQGDNKILPCSSETLEGFTPEDAGDAIIFLDAHPGNSINGLRSLNGAVTDEAKPFELDPALDPFSVENGFNPDGQSTYSAEFVDRYSRAQSSRMNRLIDKALSVRAAMEAGTHLPKDDDAFVYYRNNGRLSDFSSGVHGSTAAPQKLLMNDGSIVTEVVTTVRPALVNRARQDASFSSGGNALTLTSFLGANAIRSEHALDGIDWCSSNNSVICAVREISVPLLAVAAQGHYFIRDGEMIIENAVSTDKEFVVVEGMNHGLEACKPCAEASGADYSNATRNLFDHIASWTEARF